MAYYPKQRGTTEQLFDIGAGHNKYSFTLDASALTAARTWKIPDSNGSSGYVLSTDGAGNLSWITSGGAGADFTVPYYLPSGNTFNVAVNKQALFAEDIVVDGTLTIDGHLIDTRSPSYAFIAAEGTGTAASVAGVQSQAFGYNSSANGVQSIAAGQYTSAGGDNSIAIGYSTTNDSINSTVVGGLSNSIGFNNTLFGAGNNSYNDSSTLVGTGCLSYANDSIAFGSSTITNAPYSTVLTSYQSGSTIPGSVTTGAFNKFVSGISDTNLARTVQGTLWCRTTDATVTKLAAAVINSTTLYASVGQPSTSFLLIGQFQGTDGTDYLAGKIMIIAQTDSSGNLSLITTAPSFDYQTVGALTWDFQGGVTAGEITFSATGQAGKNISWCGSYTISQVAYA